jgi:PleD family two-component response regulator
VEPTRDGTPEFLFKLVDDRLYEAKSAGRNRAVGS